jgi:hypothetical protein
MTTFAQAVRQSKDADFKAESDKRRDLVNQTLTEIREQLQESRGGWSTTDWRDRFFAIRVRLPRRWTYGITEEEKEAVLHGLYADGWQSVEFFVSWETGAYVELRVLREPITVIPLEGEPFEATIDFSLESDKRVDQIVGTGVWRYGDGFREFIPAHRIACVRLGRKA